MTNVEYRKLSFPDAMKLANILIKYIDISTLDMKKSILDFIDDLINEIETMDYLACLEILVGRKITTDEFSGQELLNILASGMENNNLIGLLSSYKKIGFG